MFRNNFCNARMCLTQALSTVPRKAFYIGTQVGRYKPEVEEMFDFSAERVTRSVDESLSRLGLQYVDIIQVRLAVISSEKHSCM